MPETQQEMIHEIWQGLYGVPNTEENGIMGDLKEVLAKVCRNEKRITKLEITIASLIALLLGLGVLDAVNIIKL